MTIRLPEIRNLLTLGRKHMAHNHGSEYQVQIVREDGTEELSGWMNSEEQLVQAMAAVHSPQSAYWLRERSVTVAACPLCRDKEPAIAEFPVVACLSPRIRPHNSG